jgi:hypothetical protein
MRVAAPPVPTRRAGRLQRSPTRSPSFGSTCRLSHHAG